jgi:cell division cycle 20-like protein 1, cofactor of APC complex
MHQSFVLSPWRDKSQKGIPESPKGISTNKKSDMLFDFICPTPKKIHNEDRFIPSKVNSSLFSLSISKERDRSASAMKDPKPAAPTQSANEPAAAAGGPNQHQGGHNINEILREDQNLHNYANLLEKHILAQNEENNEELYVKNNQNGGVGGSSQKSNSKILHYKPKKYHQKKKDMILFYSPYHRSNVDIVEFHASQYIRKIPKQPFKILDAPHLQDDFYLNLLDWSCNNIISIGLENIVYTWSATTNKAFKLYELSSNEIVSSVAWSQSGSLLSVGESTGYVKIWDIEKQKLLRKLKNHDARVASLAWNGYLVGSGSRDRSIVQTDVRAPSAYTFKLNGHKQEVCGIKWSFDEQVLASGGNDNKVFLWSLKMQNELTRFSDHTAAVKALTWSPHQQNLLATGGGTTDKTIKFWNSNTLKLCQSIDAGSQVCNMSFNKNVNEIVSTHGYSLNQIAIWKYPSMQKIATLSGHTHRVLYLASSPDGQNIVTGAGDETLRFWNVFPPSKDVGGGSYDSVLNPHSFELR